MLPTVDDLKAYLRIEHAADDALLDGLLRQARASVEAYIRQPIEARAVTVTATPLADPWTGRYALALPYDPVGASVTVVGGGATVDPADYTVDAAAGMVTFAAAYAGAATAARRGLPYRVTLTAGLSLREDYTDAVAPAMAAAIIDWAADLYQRRNPAASYESGGGGVAVNYNETASKTMPSRVRVTLDPWRRVLV